MWRARRLLGNAAILLLVATALGGCSTKRDPRDLFAPSGVGTIVVDATLVVGRYFPIVRLRRTLSPEVPYDPGAAAVVGATVSIEGPGGAMLYADRPFTPGAYEAVDFNGTIDAVVQPDATYRLVVRTLDGRSVAATTTTPGAFRVSDWLRLDEPTLAVRGSLRRFSDYPVDPDSAYAAPENRIVYQDGLVEARFDRGDALAFQVGLKNLESDSPYVIDADFLSDHDLQSLSRDSSSPALDATENSIRLPWLAIYFAGRYTIRIFSIDRNWYDLARSLPSFGGTNLGFGTNAGDSFERPIFHVQGGIGLFGSAAVDSVGITILPKPCLLYTSPSPRDTR